MIFSEAKELMDKNMDLIITESKLEAFPYKIKFLLIAPKDKTSEDRMAVFNESLLTTNNNEGALRKLGFLNANLEVYIIGEKDVEDKQYEWYVLYNYLSETGQFS